MRITKNSETGLVFDNAVIHSKNIKLIGVFGYESFKTEEEVLNNIDNYLSPESENKASIDIDIDTALLDEDALELGDSIGIYVKLISGELFLFGRREGVCFCLPRELEIEYNDFNENEIEYEVEYSFPVEEITTDIYFDLYEIIHVQELTNRII